MTLPKKVKSPLLAAVGRVMKLPSFETIYCIVPLLLSISIKSLIPRVTLPCRCVATALVPSTNPANMACSNGDRDQNRQGSVIVAARSPRTRELEP